MKMLWVTALMGLSLMGAMDSASAQRGGRDYGYDEREYGGRGYGEREYRGRDRGEDYDDRGRGRGRGYRDERAGGFDPGEYLRCNPDVRRAVNNGVMPSAEYHYKVHGRKEGRRLSC